APRASLRKASPPPSVGMRARRPPPADANGAAGGATGQSGRSGLTGPHQTDRPTPEMANPGAAAGVGPTAPTPPPTRGANPATAPRIPSSPAARTSSRPSPGS